MNNDPMTMIDISLLLSAVHDDDGGSSVGGMWGFVLKGIKMTTRWPAMTVIAVCPFDMGSNHVVAKL